MRRSQFTAPLALCLTVLLFSTHLAFVCGASSPTPQPSAVVVTQTKSTITPAAAATPAPAATPAADDKSDSSDPSTATSPSDVVSQAERIIGALTASGATNDTSATASAAAANKVPVSHKNWIEFETPSPKKGGDDNSIRPVLQLTTPTSFALKLEYSSALDLVLLIDLLLPGNEVQLSNAQPEPLQVKHTTSLKSLKDALLTDAAKSTLEYTVELKQKLATENSTVLLSVFAMDAAKYDSISSIDEWHAALVAHRAVRFTVAAPVEEDATADDKSSQAKSNDAKASDDTSASGDDDGAKDAPVTVWLASPRLMNLANRIPAPPAAAEEKADDKSDDKSDSAAPAADDKATAAPAAAAVVVAPAAVVPVVARARPASGAKPRKVTTTTTTVARKSTKGAASASPQQRPSASKLRLRSPT